MVHRKMRGVVLACGVAATLLAAPAESKSCCFFDGLFGGARTTYRAPYVARTYAPVYTPAAACGSCVPQTCRYVPQTCYRTVYRCVPTTACLPVTCCDPCTGCPVTTYRPVTTWTRQATLVPYTAYRLVRSAPCNPCVTYGSYTGTVSAIRGSCCGPTTRTPPSSGMSPYTAPPTSAPGADAVPQTFQKESPAAKETPLKPVPDANTQLNSAPAPSLIDPGGNRTTSRPVRRTARFHLVASSPKPAAVYEPSIDDGGWRASSD